MVETTNKIEELLSSNHPDVDYLRQADISLVLSKALAETFKAQPLEPRKYFAKYLLNYAAQQRKENERKDKKEVVSMKKGDHDKHLQRVEKKKNDTIKADEEEVQKKKEFFGTLEKSKDLADNLQSLTDFLKEYTGATGVYIGQLDYPSLKIQEDSTNTAHLDYDADQVLKFKWASSNHDFMIGEVLAPRTSTIQHTTGVTHDVFQFEQDPPAEQPAEGEEIKEVPEKDITESFKHVYVKEVVREKRMHFTRVPRLGSYMAVPLIYKSCLFDEALEESVKDYIDVTGKRSEQEVQKEAWENQQEVAKQEAINNGQEFEPEVKEWEEIECAPYKTEDKKYVVCLDTMGQDREFTIEEKRFALNTVKQYIAIWEKEERDALTADRDRRVELTHGESPGTADAELDQEQAAEIAAEIENFGWQEDEKDKIYFNRHITDEEYVPEEELASIENKYKYLKVIAKRFDTNEEWLGYVENLKEYRVMRYPQIFQSILFLVDFEREEICEPKTNCLSWKIVRDLKDKRIIKSMCDYQLYGETKGRRNCKAYQTVPYVEQVLAGLIQEDIDGYHIGLGKVFKWLKMAIEGRKQDIVRRKALQQRAREVRAGKQKEAEDRKVAREEYVVDMEDKWREDTAEQLQTYEKYIARKAKKEAGDELNEEELEDEEAEQQDENFEAPKKPEWNAQEAFNQFDEDHAEIEIPPEVIAHEDSDWPMTQEEENALVDAYWAAKEP